MASARKRQSDRARGRLGKWTMFWVDEFGRKRSRAGTTDKAESERMASALEAEARLIREGLADPAEKSRREAAFRPVEVHAGDYRLSIVASGATTRHAKSIESAVLRLLADASVTTVADLAPDRIAAALGRMTARGKSARTRNHALAAVKAFARWLHESNRIAEVPRGISALRPLNEATDRRLVRRALTEGVLSRLLAAAESGPPLRARYGPSKSRHNAEWITGPERAALYRLAMGTGFRAEELRTLRPGCFRLDGPEPSIALDPRLEKNRRGTVQPITRGLAAEFRPFLEGKDPDRPVLVVPARAAKMLHADLAAAGIPVKTPEGVVDFHSIRHSYITMLIRSGVNPRVVQSLARHSTITLTIDRYAHNQVADMRDALEGKAGGD